MFAVAVRVCVVSYTYCCFALGHVSFELGHKTAICVAAVLQARGSTQLSGLVSMPYACPLRLFSPRYLFVSPSLCFRRYRPRMNELVTVYISVSDSAHH